MSSVLWRQHCAQSADRDGEVALEKHYPILNVRPFGFIDLVIFGFDEIFFRLVVPTTMVVNADELAAGIDQGTTAGASGDFVGDIDGTMVALGLSVIEIEWLHAISIDDAVSECPVGCMRMAALPKLCAGIGQVGRESEMGECFATCISLENDEVFRLISC